MTSYAEDESMEREWYVICLHLQSVFTAGILFLDHACKGALPRCSTQAFFPFLDKTFTAPLDFNASYQVSFQFSNHGKQGSFGHNYREL